MIGRIPKPRELLFWRIHFALAVLCAIDAIFGLFSLPSYIAENSDTTASPMDFAVDVLLPFPLIVGPLIAEAGYVFQKAFLRPFVWRALLMVCVLLTVVSLLVAAAFLTMADALPPYSSRVIEGPAWVVALMQLVPTWRYAYRSDHLWLPVAA
jgi:hypothetical protein